MKLTDSRLDPAVVAKTRALLKPPERRDRLWPALAHRVPAFEALRVQHAWAGYYEVHPLDHNALIGPHPGCANFWLCNGFSGHGLQHAPAAGRGVAEHLLTGAWQTLDLSAFSPQRVLDGRPFVEQAII